MVNALSTNNEWVALLHKGMECKTYLRTYFILLTLNNIYDLKIITEKCTNTKHEIGCYGNSEHFLILGVIKHLAGFCSNTLSILEETSVT